MAINREQIDLARSLLYSFSEVGEDENDVCPVHFNRISNKADFFSFDDDFLEHLKILDLIGEAKQVKSNFWSITPTRSVKFEDRWLIISPLNNLMLSEIIDLDDGATLGRFSHDYLDGYPKQNLLSWMGVPSSLADWIKDVRSAAIKNLKLTTQNPEDLEYYVPWLKSREGEWADFKIIKENDDDLFLARTKNSEFSPDYCWFKVGDVENHQSYFDKDALVQTMLGLRIMMNCRNWTIKLTSMENGKIKLNWPQFLPESFERLISVISISKEKSLKETHYILASEYLDFLVSYLSRFGLTLREI